MAGGNGAGDNGAARPAAAVTASGAHLDPPPVLQGIRERDIFQGSCRELHVLDVCLGRVYLGQGKHRVSQIKPAGRAIAPDRQRPANAAAEVCLSAHRFCDHAG